MSSTLPEPALLAEAARWHVRMTGDDRDATVGRAFEAWLEASASNRAAYAQVEAARGAARALGNRAPLLALRHETLMRVTMPRRRWLPGGALAAGLAAAVAVTAIVGWRGDIPGSPPAAMADAKIYQTGVGERLTVALADGSTATLNTASRLAVAYSSAERRLVLERGQAFFEVAKRQSRPFVVAAGDRIVTAHGTKFDVHIQTGRVEVALLEGEVTVAPASAKGAGSVRMRPNDVLLASARGGLLRHVEPAQQIADWREGMVVFDNTRLADALAEMNRYTSRPAAVGDTRLDDLRISGTFRTGEMSAFLDALQLGFDIRVVERDEQRLVLPRAKSSPEKL